MYVKSWVYVMSIKKVDIPMQYTPIPLIGLLAWQPNVKLDFALCDRHLERLKLKKNDD